MDSFTSDSNERGGSPFGMGPASSAQRGGHGSDGQQPHSATGFRKALMKTARTSGRLKDQLPNKTTFGGKGFAKPNYFAQGGQRHGMHMGAGAPSVRPATDSGADFGGDE